MSTKPYENSNWWAGGLLLENCSCQAVCPGHVHFDQLCTHELCVGYWAFRFDQGEFDSTSLAGTKAVIAYECPQHMIEGNWTQVLIVDEATSPAQRGAVEAILNGRSGGPWAVLARFVGTRLETRYLPVRIAGEGKIKRVSIAGLLEGTIEPLRGRDRSKPVTFENMFNQIHAPTQVIAKGSTRYNDGRIKVNTEGTHGLYSTFHWSVRTS